MREILFRGISIKEKEWVYGYLITGVHPEEKRDVVYIVIQENGKYIKLVEVDPKTVGQLTGVLDAYNRRIFEGDIIAFLDGMNGVDNTAVVYDGGAFCVDTQNDEVDLMPLAWTPSSFMKNIGNIHDNPELLEGNL